MTFPVLQWLLVVLGLIYLVTEASITSLIRVPLARGSGIRTGLLYCRACSGFWIGVFSAAWVWPEPWTWVVSIKAGLATMALGALWSAFHTNTAWTSEHALLELDKDDDDAG